MHCVIGLGEEAAYVVQEHNQLVTWIAAILVLAVIAFAAYLVTKPAVAVGVLTAFAAVLATLPAVIRAIRGGGKQ